MADYNEALNRIARADVGTVRRDEPLRPHSTWRIGGPADLWIEPHGADHVVNFIRAVRADPVPFVVVGYGSNLLFDDAGLRGAVLMCGRRMARFSIDGATVWAQAGVTVPRLALSAGRAGLTGLEHTIGIPGTLGGLVAMNGGSRRRSIGEVVRSVTVVTPLGQIETLPAEACGFAYRTSRFQASGDIIVEATLELVPGDRETIRRDMLDVLRSRRAKFPRREPNCGSVFKSEGDMYERFGPPGKVIEDAGCKGWREGDAQVSPKHANFIVNRGSASSADVLKLIRRVREAVHQRTQMWLQCEAKYVPPSGRPMPVEVALGPPDCVK
jgi:UDP-N-acetylmuramate dehydrogenase